MHIRVVTVNLKVGNACKDLFQVKCNLRIGLSSQMIVDLLLYDNLRVDLVVSKRRLEDAPVCFGHVDWSLNYVLLSQEECNCIPLYLISRVSGGAVLPLFH